MAMERSFLICCAVNLKPALCPENFLSCRITSESVSVCPAQMCAQLWSNSSEDLIATKPPCSLACEHSVLLSSKLSCTVAGNVEKGKAEQDSFPSAILNGKKSPVHVHHEICHRHFTAGD